MRKIFIFLGVLVFSVSVFAAVPQAKAMTVDELQALVVSLQQQIAKLQAQLSALQGTTPTAWCHDFNTNLRIDNQGSEVEALMMALEKEGFNMPEKKYLFDEAVASAVVGFQEKYASEILTPNGLKYGTGFAGPATRARLNKLYGCGVTVVPLPVAKSIIVLSPNGGETWVAGNTYQVSWTNNSGRNVRIELSQGDNWIQASSAINSTITTYDFTIANSTHAGSNYKIRVTSLDAAGGADYAYFDDSNNYFSIVSAIANLPTPCGSYGDVSVDGNVTNDDVTLVNKYIVGTATLTDNQKTYADVNNDGLVNSGDVLLMQKYIAGTISTFSVCNAAASSVTVTSPNGGEAWTMGKTYQINWTSKNVNRVTINWVKLSGYSDVISSIAILENNPGSYSWTVPFENYVPGFTAGYLYRIEVFDRDHAGVVDRSNNYFTIASPLSPCGSYGDINGDGYVNADDVTFINKYIVGTAILTDAQKTKADVNGDGLVNSGDSLLIQKYVLGTASTFSVCTAPVPSITVISPNGGETLTVGQIYPIQVQCSQGISKTLNISLRDDRAGPSYTTLFSGVTCVLGGTAGYNWTVPSTIQPGNTAFKIKVETFDSSTIDYSDNYFSIASSGKISPCGTYGDVNGDGYVTNDDATLVNQYIVGTAVLTDGQKTKADVNGDGLINSGDSLLIQKYVLGTASTFSVCSAGTGLNNTESQLANISTAVLRLMEEINKLLGI